LERWTGTRFWRIEFGRNEKGESPAADRVLVQFRPGIPWGAYPVNPRRAIQARRQLCQ